MAKINARPFGLLAAIALGALASLAALPAGAATSHKQSVQQAKKPEVKKPEAKKPEVKKPEAKEPDARNSFAKKERSSSKKTAHKRGKPARHAAKSKRGKKPAADDDDDEDEKPAAPALTGDLALVKNAIDLARKGKTTDATDAAKAIADPAGQKLVEWFLLRHSEADARFARFAAFINGNPDWPSNTLLRRRAEARLWQEKAEPATVRAFFAEKAPLTAKGR